MIHTIKPEIEKKDIVLYNDIVYANRLEEWPSACVPLKLHLIREYPENCGFEKVPLILWVNGGAWRCVSPFRFMMNFGYLAQAGFAVASIQYRVSSQGFFPAPLQDVKAALRYLRAHADLYGIDGERVGIMGESAGGHLAAMVGVTPGCIAFSGEDWADQSESVKAVACWYGGFDLAMMNKDLQNTPSKDSPQWLLLGGTAEEFEERAKAASPVSYVSGKEPPFLLLHGTQDDTVSIQQSQRMYEALHDQNVSVEFYKLEGAGHATPEFVQPEVQKIILDFFERHV